MISRQLTTHDLNVLEKIRDPESAPSVPIIIDSSLPRDPHVTNSTEYDRLASSEHRIILEYQNIEIQLATLNPSDHSAQSSMLGDYDTCTNKLIDLIISCPLYASAHNNHAQALRRKFGESVLLKTKNPFLGFVPTASSQDEEITSAAITILYNLDTAISLLTPRTPFTSISPQAAKTLSQAYTQRGALYYVTAKQMNNDASLRLRIEKQWTADDLHEMASRDFVMGGRYGNEIAKGLAVATNPTAKLCGSIVREAMKKEFGQSVA